jgi:hypothetical protein
LNLAATHPAEDRVSTIWSTSPSLPVSFQNRGLIGRSFAPDFGVAGKRGFDLPMRSTDFPVHDWEWEDDMVALTICSST